MDYSMFQAIENQNAPSGVFRARLDLSMDGGSEAPSHPRALNKIRFQ